MANGPGRRLASCCPARSAAAHAVQHEHAAGVPACLLEERFEIAVIVRAVELDVIVEAIAEATRPAPAWAAATVAGARWEAVPAAVAFVPLHVDVGGGTVLVEDVVRVIRIVALLLTDEDFVARDGEALLRARVLERRVVLGLLRLFRIARALRGGFMLRSAGRSAGCARRRGVGGAACPGCGLGDVAA